MGHFDFLSDQDLGSIDWFDHIYTIVFQLMNYT